MSVDISEKKGYNSYILRLIAYAVTIAGMVFTFKGANSLEGLNYLSWISYPIFAYLLAMGFDYTSNKIRYFVRLLIFAAIAEIPFNLYTAEKLLYKYAQNGMFTLCAGLAVLIIIDFIQKKLDNLIISGVCCYGAGYGAFWLTRHFNCECYSFGVMMIVMFYISRHVKYSKALQCLFFALLSFSIMSEKSITIILGNYQYSFPYRIFGFVSLILIWFTSEKRGPNSLPLKISMYLFYPLILAAAAALKNILIL